MSGTVTLIGGPYDGYATQQPRDDKLSFMYPIRHDLPPDGPLKRLYYAIYERQDDERFVFRRFA